MNESRTDSSRSDDVYIEHKLRSNYPDDISAFNATSSLLQLCMQDTDKSDHKKLLNFLDNFLPTFCYDDSEYQRKYETEEQ